MSAQLLPFCQSRIDRLILHEHGEHIAREAGVSVRDLLTAGVPAYCFAAGLRIRMHGGEVFEFPCALLVKRPQLLVVVTPWSGMHVIDRGRIAEFELFEPTRDAAIAPTQARPIGIAPPKPRAKQRRPATVIDFPAGKALPRDTDKK